MMRTNVCISWWKVLKDTKIHTYSEEKWHQKHTICNFILSELWRYVRISTQEISFLKTKRLFRKVIFSSRNSFLKFPPKYITEEKFYFKRKETEILENAEQIFQETFSDDFLNLMENVLNSDSGAIWNSILSLQNNMVVSNEVCSIFCFTNYWKHWDKRVCFCFYVFPTGFNIGRKWGIIEPYSSWLLTSL